MACRKYRIRPPARRRPINASTAGPDVVGPDGSGVVAGVVAEVAGNVGPPPVHPDVTATAIASATAVDALTLRVCPVIQSSAICP
jgi:hypothetical protein